MAARAVMTVLFETKNLLVYEELKLYSECPGRK